MSGENLGPIPRGIEVLVKKAAVDPEFRTLLLADRMGAAEAIKLELDPSETALLQAVPRDQLEAIVARTRVPDEHRRAFLGKVAAAMLAALGMTAPGEAEGGFGMGGSGGIRPQDMPPRKPARQGPPEDRKRKKGDERGQGKGPEQANPVHGDEPRPDAPKQAVRRRVMEMIAQRFGVPAEQLTLQTSILKDLRPKPRQMIQFRAELQKEFGLKISYRAFKKMPTVGQMVDYLEREIARQEAFRKRQRGGQQGPAGQPRRPALPPKPPRPGGGGTFGVRPDRPPFGGLGGAGPR